MPYYPPLPVTDGGVTFFLYSQVTPSDTWIITHNLGFEPNVTVQDTAGTTIEGETTYVDNNQMTIIFSAAFSGEAHLS